MTRWLDRKSGVTLVELLVAIALSSLALTLIGGLYLFSNKLVIGFQEKSLVNDQRILLESEIRGALRDLERIISAGDDGIVFRTFRGKTMQIEGVVGGAVSVGGRALLPVGMELGGWKIEYFGGRGDIDGALSKLPDQNENFVIDGGELSLIAAIKISYSLVYRNIERKSEVVFVPRAEKREVL